MAPRSPNTRNRCNELVPAPRSSFDVVRSTRLVVQGRVNAAQAIVDAKFVIDKSVVAPQLAADAFSCEETSRSIHIKESPLWMAMNSGLRSRIETATSDSDHSQPPSEHAKFGYRVEGIRQTMWQVDVARRSGTGTCNQTLELRGGGAGRTQRRKLTVPR